MPLDVHDPCDISANNFHYGGAHSENFDFLASVQLWEGSDHMDFAPIQWLPAIRQSENKERQFK